MKIHQLIHTLSYGDAISGEALALQRSFQELGVTSKIYAINTHPKYVGKTESYQELSADFDGQVILHYSLGSPLNQLYKSLKSAKRSIIFHNLTPSTYFADINPKVAQDIEQGWRELPELCAISDLVLSDSTFNALELKELGIDSQILPLPFDPSRWEQTPNIGIKNLILQEGGLHLLHVGRLAPNKCIEDIIKTFYFLRHKFPDLNSRLWLVGIDIDTELYSYGLKRLAQELSVYDFINFTGPLTDEEILALYQNCSAYLCMSAHEGFCVPLIEAMNFSLPVLAYNCGAVPETLGSGGILFNEKRYPEIAELIFKIYSDRNLRESMTNSGLARVSELTFEVFKKNVSRFYLQDCK
jgi:glycosyltransferase involved in cell wall biosynthesis